MWTKLINLKNEATLNPGSRVPATNGAKRLLTSFIIRRWRLVMRRRRLASTYWLIASTKRLYQSWKPFIQYLIDSQNSTKRVAIKQFTAWVGVVDQLLDRSLPIPEVRGSDPIIGKLSYKTFVNCQLYWKDEKRKRGFEWPIFIKKKNYGQNWWHHTSAHTPYT